MSEDSALQIPHLVCVEPCYGNLEVWSIDPVSKYWKRVFWKLEIGLLGDQVALGGVLLTDPWIYHPKLYGREEIDCWYETYEPPTKA